MNKLLSTILLISAHLLLTTTSAYSQDFRWGERGGSTQSAGDAQVETIYDMDVDKNGNVYVLSRVYKTDISVGGHTIQGYGNKDVLLSSFNCQGKFRWMKLFGNSIGDIGYDVCTDKTDGVYVVFDMMAYNDSGYIDSDSTIAANTTKTLYLVKYDTSGNLKWTRTPQPDTIPITSSSFTGSIDMDIDGQGNISWVCQLAPGEYGGSGGFVVNDTSDYILKYDRNGNFQGGLKIEIDGAFGSGMAIDKNSGNIYISRYSGTVTAGNTKITGRAFIASFDKNGKYRWIRYSNQAVSPKFLGRPIIDNKGFIYLTGNARVGDTINGYVIKNSSASSPFLIAMDENGNNVWATDISAISASSGWGLALRNNDEVTMVGNYTGSINFDPAFPSPSTGGTYNMFLARFNIPTGRVLGVDFIAPAPGNEHHPVIVSDHRNNVYIGGEFTSSITVNGTQLNNTGGETDWFVAKFGHDNCNCTNIPEPKFSFTKNGLDVNFSYTGGLYSTIEWDFCDGNKSTQSNPTHTYLAKGIYTVCVKVTNNCGDNTYCDVVDFWPADINERVSIGSIKIYPNPASEILYVDGLETEATIELFDIVGRKVKTIRTMNNRESINMSMLQPGNYIIQITNTNGHKMTGKVSK